MPCTAGVWLGIKFSMCTHRCSIAVEKIREPRAYFFVVITDNTGIPPERVKARNLEVLVGKVSHMSSTSVPDKIFLLALYRALTMASHFTDGNCVMKS